MPLLADYSRVAREILGTSLQVNPGDRVWIQSWDHTLDLAKALAGECSSRACPYVLTVRDEENWLQSILRGTKRQLGTLTPYERAALEETDHFIFTMGPKSPVPWKSIPDDKRSEVSVWLDTRYDKSSYARTWAKVAKASGVKMLAIEATLATPGRAKAQGLDYDEWREVMFRGCLADHRAIANRAKKLAGPMSGKGRVTINTTGETRLAFDLAGRPVGISDGVSTREMARDGRVVFLPAGAVEVSVDEESANGRVVYSAPVRIGNDMVENLTLELENGAVVRHSATRGIGAFSRYLERGGKDAGRLSYFGFGLNPNLRRGFTQDDKVLGGLTLGFGNNTPAGGRISAGDQWWAAIAGATLKVDGTTLMSEGTLTI